MHDALLTVREVSRHPVGRVALPEFPVHGAHLPGQQRQPPAGKGQATAGGGEASRQTKSFKSDQELRYLRCATPSSPRRSSRLIQGQSANRLRTRFSTSRSRTGSSQSGVSCLSAQMSIAAGPIVRASFGSEGIVAPGSKTPLLDGKSTIALMAGGRHTRRSRPPKIASRHRVKEAATRASASRWRAWCSRNPSGTGRRTPRVERRPPRR